jgi:hypothetical protein
MGGLKRWGATSPTSLLRVKPPAETVCAGRGEWSRQTRS